MFQSRRLVWTGVAAVLGLAVVALGIVLSIGQLSTGQAQGNSIGELRRAVNRYQYTGKAEMNGWVLIPGLDHCFNLPGTGGMGFHYIKPPLDLSLDEKQPEALVYAPQSNGRLELAAVEYIVPATAWDLEHPGELPEVHGIDLHLNPDLGVYVLHIWLFEDNPAGMFKDWNPAVTCPTPAP